MAKLTLATITSGYASIAAMNSNFDLIEAALENTLSRDGTSPNAMLAALDMNSNKIVNLAQPVNAADAVRLVDLQDAVVATPLPSQTGNANKVLKTDGTVVAWVDLITHLKAIGDVTTFTETLLDDADAATARSTLGLGTMAVENVATIVPPTQFLRKNAIINGDFNVWQRGTSFAAAAAGAYSADRWQYDKSGTMVHTLSRSTDVPTVAEAGRLFNYSLLVDCTTADAAIAAGDYCVVMQKIEGFNWLPLAQKALKLSFWVKATKTGTYCIHIGNSVQDRSFVAEYTINTTETWEKKTINISASPSAGTWDYTTGIGAYVLFTLAAGSTYHTTAGAWQTGVFTATANQVNACDSTSNDFRITGVQLEAGSVATDFEYRTIGEEQNLCDRYCQMYEGSSFDPFHMAVEYTNVVTGVMMLRCPMRVPPTLTTLGNNFNVETAGILNTDVNAPTISNDAVNAVVLTYSTTNTVTGNRPCWVRARTGQTERLIFSAEL